MRLLFFSPILALTLVLCACEASHNYVNGGSVSTGYTFNDQIDSQLVQDAEAIINSNCLGCHGSTANAYLDFPELINDGFIVAGPPSDSVLFRCLNNSSCITRDGSKTVDNMAGPAYGNLSQGQLDTMNLFIDELFNDPE